MSARNLVRQHAAPVLLCFLLVVCLFYQAYRYPLQINSARTSPTYSDTPAWLQFGKWGLVAAVGLALALLIARDVRATLATGSRLRSLALVLQLGLIVLTLIRILFGAASVEPWVLLIGTATGLLVTLTTAAERRASTLISRVIVVYALVCIAVEVVQVVLYLVADRLPALAYADSPSVRFGSVLDDPNGFAVVLAALIPTTWFMLSGRPNLRLCTVLALLCCLPLTQSWTGVTATVVALAATYLFARGVQRNLRRASAVVVSAVIVVGVAAFFARATIAELIRLKQGSVQSHAAAFDRIASQPSPGPTATAAATASATATATAPVTQAPTPLPHPTPPPEQVLHATWTSGIESSYVNLLVNYGPLLLVVYIALGVVAVILLLRGWTRLPLALRTGSAAYLICFLLASANLGLDRTFPCNILYFFFCGLAFASSTSRRVRSEIHGAQEASAGADLDRRLERTRRARTQARGSRVLEDAV